MDQLDTAGAWIRTGKKFEERAKEEVRPSVTQTVGYQLGY